jgi:type II secretory pathway pseudopilin PulG
MIERGPQPQAALTLLEVTVVIMVIAILAVLTLPVISKFRARAQRVQCAANLRSLYIAADLHLQQNQSWPQIRLGGEGESDWQDYATGWIAALAPFGVERKTWICPTMQAEAGDPDYMNPENARVDYLAMPFDDKPTTPHQWPTMLWFAETGDVHGNGNLMVLADGSIRDLKAVVGNAAPAPQ